MKMKTYALIGGSSTIAQTLIKSLENQDVNLLVYSRSEESFS
jgi:short-subunit dehydrogenase